MPPFTPNLSIKDLHSLLDGSLLVRHIAEPLLVCNSTDEASTVRKTLSDKNFDLIGVTQNGTLSGYVRQVDLVDGDCCKALIPFDYSEIISSSTPLIELLPLLKSRPMFFVLDRTTIDSIVSRADLQKWPVRMLLFGLVSMLEMYLLRMVRACYPGDSFSESLGETRVEAAEKLFNHRRTQDHDIDLADCLQICDKVHLLVDKKGFREFFGLPGKEKTKSYFRRMEDLRNKLAHSQDLTLGADWQEVIEIAGSVESFLRRCDQSWDEFVATVACPSSTG
jgi:hypothetical protein